MASYFYSLGQPVILVWHPNFFPHFRLSIACNLINTFKVELSRPATGDGIRDEMGKFADLSLCGQRQTLEETKKSFEISGNVWEMRFPVDVATAVDAEFNGASPNLRRIAFLTHWLVTTHNQSLKFVDAITPDAIWRNEYIVRWTEITNSTHNLIPQCHLLGNNIPKLLEHINSSPIFDVASKTHTLINHDGIHRLSKILDGKSFVKASLDPDDATVIPIDSDEHFSIFRDNSLPVFERMFDSGRIMTMTRVRSSEIEDSTIMQESLKAVVDGNLAGVLAQAQKLPAVERANAVMFEMLETDKRYYAWSQLDWVGHLGQSKKTIAATPAWTAIMQYREVNKKSRKVSK